MNGLDRMPSLRSRSLTAGEIALSRSVFGNEIEYASVRVLQLPAVFPGAMVPFGRTIVFAGWRAPRDFAAASPAEQGWFIHEMAHVWQATHGVVLAVAKISALSPTAYEVKIAPGRSFPEYNIEAQAEIVRFLFHARRGVTIASAPTRDILETLWATRRQSLRTSR